MASGFWFNIGGETSVSLQLNEDGTLSLTAGTPDIGGLRASLCMMAAEELGVDLGKIRVQIGDTGQLGYNFLTGGSRATSRAAWQRWKPRARSSGKPASAPPNCGSCRKRRWSTRTAACARPDPTPASMHR